MCARFFSFVCFTFSLTHWIFAKQVERDKKKGTKGVYRCPLYVYPVRGGSVDKPSLLMDVDLKTGPRGDWQFWAKRGTALLLTRDDV
jgi:dynein heavy chain